MKLLSEKRRIQILKEYLVLGDAKRVAKKHRIHYITLYHWKKKYGEITISKAERESIKKHGELIDERKRDRIMKKVLAPVIKVPKVEEKAHPQDDKEIVSVKTDKQAINNASFHDQIKAIEAKELEILQKMYAYREANRIEFFTKPNPLQAQLLAAWDNPLYKVFTFTGANRIGKTTIGTIIAFSVLFGHRPWDKKKLHFPHDKPRKIRYIGQDWEKQISKVVVPEMEKWWPANRPVVKKKNNQGIEATWTDTLTGGTVEIMSNGQESDLHEGWSGDLIIYDEPPKRAIRVANARGLIDRNGRELFCMTLLKEAWVDREVIKAVDGNGMPDKTVFNISGDISNNIGFGITQEGVDQYIKTLTEDEIEARIKGIPSYMSGLVYPSFDRKKHLRDRFKIPLDWIIDIAIDIHPREKQAVLFCAVNPRGDKYLVNEIWGHGDGKWVAEEIVGCIKYCNYRVGTIIIDPLSKGDSNNDNTVFDKIQAILWAYGMILMTASKDKNSGILEIKNHLKGPNNEPSLFIFNDLVRTIFEIEGYTYDKETQRPIDKDDHMMENLYRLMLLNTEWTPVEFEGEEAQTKTYQGRSAVGGY
jgi:transposase